MNIKWIFLWNYFVQFYHRSRLERPLAKEKRGSVPEAFVVDVCEKLIQEFKEQIPSFTQPRVGCSSLMHKEGYVTYSNKTTI